MALPKINKLLLALIAVINLYIIALPLYPLEVYWWQTHVHHRQAQLAEQVKNIKSGTPLAAAQGERLIIPSIALDQAVVEGTSVYTVNKGVWHYPKGASPGQTGNTVFIGHRFTYQGPAVFAHLDLVKKGDDIVLLWNGQKISYTVSDIKTVLPSDTSIIQPTKDKRITIYTCTPMWHTTYRLAVIAQEDKS